LAEHYLSVIDTGVANRLVLFAPRRMGKTEFLTHDLMPLALEKKMIPIYINLWENPNEPQEAVINGLTLTLKALTGQTFKLLKGAIVGIAYTLKTKFDLFGADFSAGINKPDHPKATPSNNLTLISKLFAQLVTEAKGKKIVLIIDEIQHLTTSTQYTSLTFNLRTNLDTHKQHISTILTGSTRSGLRKLFSNQKAAFYGPGDTLEFPNMGKEFVRHITRAFNKATKLTLSEYSANKIFKKLDCNPDYFRNIIRVMLIQKTDKIDTIYRDVISLMAKTNEYQSLLNKLRPIDIRIIPLLLENKKVYSEKILNKLSKQLGKKITSGIVQASIRKLEMLNVITKNNYGDYIMETPGLIEWLKQSNQL